MTIQFEGASEKRKELVKAISEVLGQPSYYHKAPSFAFTVGDYTILRNGDVEADDFIDQKVLGQLLLGLRARGFYQIGSEFAMPEEAPTEQDVAVATAEAFTMVPVATESPVNGNAAPTQPVSDTATPAPTVSAPTVPAPTAPALAAPAPAETGIDGVVIRFPKEGVSDLALANLRKLVEGKAWLIRQALEADELPIGEDGDMLSFPWLKGTPSYELIYATTFLIAALIKLAKKQTRVTLTANTTDNPRYAFRCFLLRLGFIGAVYKDVRRTLMAGIPGNGSHRYIETPEEAVTLEPEVAPEPCAIRKIEEYEGATEEYALSAEENASNNMPETEN